MATILERGQTYGLVLLKWDCETAAVKRRAERVTRGISEIRVRRNEEWQTRGERELRQWCGRGAGVVWLRISGYGNSSGRVYFTGGRAV